MSISHPAASSVLRHLALNALSGLLRLLTPFASGRRLSKRGDTQPFPNQHHQHFGSLDDQLLDDLGLQRSEIRAAEFGVLPGDQALHHEAPKKDEQAN
ncbi:MAG: hypothetical protein AAF543_05925 [Pseudomonadota bacterium]